MKDKEYQTEIYSTREDTNLKVLAAAVVLMVLVLFLCGFLLVFLASIFSVLAIAA